MTDKKMGVYCEGGLIEEIITLEDAFDYIENICGSDYKIIYKKQHQKFEEKIDD
jgi:hypothetical protein